MKRFCCLLLCFLVVLTLVIPCGAETQDYLFVHKDSPVYDIIEQCEPLARKIVTEFYMEKYFLPAGEKTDQSKLTLRIDQTAPRYSWTPLDIKELLLAPDLGEFLEKQEVSQYLFRCEYDGKRLKDVYLHPDISNYHVGIKTFPNSVEDRLLDKDDLLSAIKAAGAEEYRPIFQFHYCHMCFALAEKDGQRYLLYLPVDETDPHVAPHAAEYAEFTKQQQELITKQIWTIDEAVTFMKELESYSRTLGNEEKIYSGGTGETETPEKENATTPPTALWIGIGGGLAIVLTITLLLILKKKRA